MSFGRERKGEREGYQYVNITQTIRMLQRKSDWWYRLDAREATKSPLQEQ